jgi:hypothetical protein
VSHPAAGWFQWGGSIEPRGVPIVRTRHSPGAGFATRAVGEGMEDFADKLDRNFDALSRRHGWR